MELLLAIVIGGLYGSGIFLMLRRSLAKLIIGLVLLSQGANLLIFVSAGLARDHAPPVIAPGDIVPAKPIADPLPQALILTAIVINFGVLAFTLVLFQRAYQVLGTDDLNQMKATDT